MSNYKRGHRATSIGTQLLSNYRKYLAAYERAWAAADLPEHPLPPVSACGWLLAVCKSPRMLWHQLSLWPTMACTTRNQRMHAVCKVEQLE